MEHLRNTLIEEIKRRNKKLKEKIKNLPNPNKTNHRIYKKYIRNLFQS